MINKTDVDKVDDANDLITLLKLKKTRNRSWERFIGVHLDWTYEQRTLLKTLTKSHAKKTLL